jgi:hypothetical protein
MRKRPCDSVCTGTYRQAGTITAHGSNGTGTWTDILTLSADGAMLTGQNTGSITLTETRQ